MGEAIEEPCKYAGCTKMLRPVWCEYWRCSDGHVYSLYTRGSGVETWEPTGGYTEDHIAEIDRLNAELARERERASAFRESVLNERHQLAEAGLDNDQINAVLGLFDDAFGDACYSSSGKAVRPGTG